MELDHDFGSSTPRMPVSRMAQLGAMAMVVLIVLVVVFWNPTPPAPEGAGSGAVSAKTTADTSGADDTTTPYVETGGTMTVASGADDTTTTTTAGTGSDTALTSTAGTATDRPGAGSDTTVSTPGAGSATTTEAVARGNRSDVRSDPERRPTRPITRRPVRRGPPAGSKFHEVTDEDTLVRLAIRYYGRASAYKRIIEANRHQLRDPNRIPIGMRLVIPPAGASTSAPRRSGTRIAPPSELPRSGGKRVNGQEYVVQAGDSFIRLARRFYGGSGGWRKIMEANNLTENGLRVGQRIIIPSR